MSGPTPAPAYIRLLLALVVCTSVLLAGVWALFQPMFQAQDENEHFEYVVALYEANGFPGYSNANVGLPAGRPLPDPAYLEHATGFLVIAGHPEMKAPVGYGSIAYFQKLNGGATQLESTDRVLHPRLLLEHVSSGYYVLAAAWLRFFALLIKSAAALFFVARFFNVALLVPSVLFTYAIAREVGLLAPRALGVTAIIAFLPVTTFVFSYVQPDALGAVLVLAAVYTGLRQRRDRDSFLWPALLGLTMGLLAVTKFDYWIVTALAVGASMLASRLTGRGPGTARFGLQLVVAAVPTLVLVALQSHLYRSVPAAPVVSLAQNPGLTDTGFLRQILTRGPLTAAHFLGLSVGYTLLKVFFSGTAQGFWGDFGWLDTPLKVGPGGALAVLALPFAATLITLVLAVARLIQVGRRLWRVGRRQGPRPAMRVATANLVVNAYLAFVFLIIGLNVASGSTLGAQGRYFLPFLLGWVLFAIGSTPRALPRGLGRIHARTLLAGLGLFTIVGVLFGLPTLHARFYGNGRDLTPVAETAPQQIGRPGSYRLALVPPALNTFATGPTLPRKIALTASLASGEPLGVIGWAADPASGGPASAVFITIDGRRWTQAVGGDDPPLPGATDPRLARAGFDAIVDTTGLPPGWHAIAIEVSGVGGTIYQPAQVAWLEVT